MTKHSETVHIHFYNTTVSYLAVINLNTTKLPDGFMVVPDEKKIVPNSVKLHWDKLNRTVKGVKTPHENQGWITRRFNELSRNGWIVEKTILSGINNVK